MESMKDGVGERVGSRVLDHLKSMERASRDANEEGGAVLKAGGDECVDERFLLQGERGSV